MQVLLANEYGFCFGVERAVEMVEEAIEAGDTVRSLGPLIHNEQEMQRLAHEGVTTIQEPVQIQRGETAVIRAHGVTPQVQRELEEKASKVVDATCPFVTRVQKLAARAALADRHVIVVGNPEHPEMIGVKGYAPDHAFVVRDETEIADLPVLRNPLIVSQTTIKAKTFFDTAEAVKNKTSDNVEIINTICSATRDRQEAARALAGMVDALSRDHRTAPISDAEHVMLEWVEQFTRDSTRLGPDDLEKLRAAGFTDQAILQIAIIAGWFNYANRMADALGVGKLNP